MEWSKTKTMFIIVFLILDLFLATQLFNKYSKGQIDVIQNTSDEERLKADEITYDQLPSDNTTSQYVKGKSKIFTNKDIKSIGKNQSALITKDGTGITSYFNKPIVVSGQINQDSMEQVVKKNILYGDQYTFWKYDKDMKQIIYSQTYKGKKIYQNINGQIIFYLNDKNEIVSYDQTLLKFGEDSELKEGDVLAPIKAIDTLHNKGMLKRKSHIKTPDLGYYTRIQSSDLQLLVPTWHFTVVHDGKTEDFFVNAFEGEVFNMNNSSSINDPNSNSKNDSQLQDKLDLKEKQKEPGDY